MSPAHQPILVQVLAHMPTDWSHCSHCERLFDAADIGEQVHREIQASYPQEILKQAGHLAACLQELSTRYGDRLHIRVIDPQSMQGFALSLRHWVRRYPTFIVNGRKLAGRDPEALDRLLAEQVAQAASAGGNQGMWMGAWKVSRETFHRILRMLGEMLYGMTTFDWVRDLRRTRGEVERLFVLVVFGDLIGLPILPPYYTLRLLPYVIPALDRWKRSLLRERDWTDLTELIEGID